MKIRRLALLAAALAVLLSGISAQAAGFEELSAQCGAGEDLKAFLEIPGAGCVLPIMQRSGDDGFYLNHDSSGAESASGALYTESAYNAAGFTDPVTVVYGRRMDDGSMFGSLQKWYSGSFDACRKILLHLPGETREYTAFAAIPFSATHILYYNDFTNERAYNAFFDDVYAVRRLGMQLSADLRPAYGEKVIILSTGLMGDSSQRYLVMAKQNIQ